LRAAGALALQLGQTVGANQEVTLDALLAIGAGQTALDVLQQRFLLERALVGLDQRVAGPQDQVDEQAWQVHDRHPQRGENLDHQVWAAALDVSERPDDQRERQANEVGDAGRNQDLEDVGDTLKHSLLPYPSLRSLLATANLAGSIPGLADCKD